MVRVDTNHGLDVPYKETCTYCAGTGKVSTNFIKFNYDLLEIVE